MSHLVVAPDKFRGTASATDVADAVVRAAIGIGWTGDAVPMSDGGEGLLDAVGGQTRTTTVPGPLGAPVQAEWRLLADTGAGTTAVIEMAQAGGRALLAHPAGDDPMRASTAGVGQLLLVAAQARVARIVIGCGGSATTDGGWGAVDAVGGPDALAGIDLVVACDVTTRFGDAAALFGPQKGATPEQVVELSARLATLATRYRRDFGVDVVDLPGAGAAGGLAGGLVVLGARIEPGFDLVARLTRLGERMHGADLVVTGEGHLDPPSFSGKVPGGVLELVAGSCPVLCVVGGADPELLAQPPPGLEVVSLTQRFGAARARRDTVELVAQVVADALPRFCP